MDHVPCTGKEETDFFTKLQKKRITDNTNGYCYVAATFIYY